MKHSVKSELVVEKCFILLPTLIGSIALHEMKISSPYFDLLGYGFDNLHLPLSSINIQANSQYCKVSTKLVPHASMRLSLPLLLYIYMLRPPLSKTNVYKLSLSFRLTVFLFRLAPT